MKKSFVLVWILFHPFFSLGQNNLVPNWSFENILDCNPHNGGDLLKAIPWFAGNSFCSTDLYNTCDTNYFHVPDSYTGYQYPRSGNSYAGFIPFEYPTAPLTFREYAEVHLVSPLDSGKSYCVSFYVNAANPYSTCYISSIGAVFSYDTLKPPTGNMLIDTIPDVSSSSIISDTLYWTRISGIYTPLNIKKFITIGNFYNNTNTPCVCIVENHAYYLLDDVSIVEVSNADAGNDTSMCAGETIPIGGLPTFEADYTWYELTDSAGSNSIDSIHIAKPHISATQTTTYVMWKRQCNVVTTDTIIVTVNCVGMKEPRQKQELIVYPNPANETVQVKYTGGKALLTIRDLLGKEIKKLPVEENTQIDVSALAEGIYFISVIENGKVTGIQKFVVQH